MIDFESLLFNIDITSGRIPRPGALLVAEPFLREQYFNHSVICIVEYEPRDKAMGIVLNQPTGYSLQELLPGITVEERIKVYCGGPMSCDRLYFLHTLGDIIPGSRYVTGDLYIGGSFDAMTDYINSGFDIDGSIRFFVGYSGWDPGQLDEEIVNNVWAVTDVPDTAMLFEGDEDAYWHRWVKMLGHSYRGWRYHPRNPQAN